MDCDSVNLHLSAYLDGEVPGEMAAAVRQHLETCPACRVTLEELRATVDLLRRLRVHPAPAGLAEDVRHEIERRILLADVPCEPPEVQVPERTLPLARRRSWPRAMALAAAVLLAAGIGILVYLETAGPGPREPTIGGHLACREEKFEESAAVATGRPPAAGWKAGAAEGDGDSLAHVGVMIEGLDLADFLGAEQISRGGLVLGTNVVVRDGQTIRLTAAPSAVAGAGGRVSGLASVQADAAMPLDLLAAAHAQQDAYQAKVRASLADRRPGLADARPGPGVGAGTVAVAGGTLTVVVDGPTQVQHAMNWVANGDAGLQELQEVATPGNLAGAGNQVVIQATSRREANEDLEGLFRDNGWLPLADARGRALERTVALADEARSARAWSGAAAAPGAAGFYFLAHRDGEDTWVVITGRDDLSRFGSRLAAADRLNVAYEYGEPAAAIARLQESLRGYALKGKAEVQAPAPAREVRASLRYADDEAVAPAGPPPGPRKDDREGRERGDRHAPAPAAAPAEPAGPAALLGEVAPKGAPAAEAEAGRRHLAAAGGIRKAESAAESLELGAFAGQAKVQETAPLYSWTAPVIRYVAPLPPDQVLLVIRIRPEAAAVRSAREAAPAAGQ